MPYNSSRALALLKLGTQSSTAAFREGQEDAIRHVVDGCGRLLVLQKTGWGKSSVYFIAAKLLRDQGGGPALLVSPLLSLMRNQIAAAKRMGLRAATIHSENEKDWAEVATALARNEVDILLISPERLANIEFRSEVLDAMADQISLLVVDEAHCISDWGHDFRPHYRLLERFIRALPADLRVLATTATANERVLGDLSSVLGPNLSVLRGDLSRPSLFLQTLRLPKQSQRYAWLAEQVPTLPGHGIIYVLTVRDAIDLSEWLRSKGIQAEAYTGESGERRVDLENALLENKVKVLVATTALGMGFDKPDLAFVIHYQSPSSVVGYYQQVGRAGRALKAAYGVLLSGSEESEINGYFISSAFPTRDQVADVLSLLSSEPDGLSVSEISQELQLGRSRVEKTMMLLSLETPAPLVKKGAKWILTATRLSASFWQRAERLTQVRKTEQRTMQDYVNLKSGHMEFLIKALDGKPVNFRVPELPSLSGSVNSSLLLDAEEFLLGKEEELSAPPANAKHRNEKGGAPIRNAFATDSRASSVKSTSSTTSMKAASAWGAGRATNKPLAASPR